MEINELIAKLGITPSEMQRRTAEVLAEGEGDAVVLSPTGTGKTLAYLVPLASMLDAAHDQVQAVVVVPGRELALQSANVLKNMGSGLRTMACYGGRATMDEHRDMRKIRPQILFGTPGRLNDHIAKGNINTDKLTWLVIDEFDKCLEMGFADEMTALLNRLPKVRRRVLLSATRMEAIPDFVRMGRTVEVNFLPDEGQVSDQVEITVVRSRQKDKLPVLARLLGEWGSDSSIVFLNYRESVCRVTDELTEAGFAVTAFHGGMEQRDRESALYRFTNASCNILVATNLASRGLDIPEVDHIIHYHLPESEEEYIHRVGRTARWKARGTTCFLLGPDERIPAYVEGSPVEHVIPAQVPPPALPKMTTIYIGKGKKDKISKMDVVGFLCKIGGLDKSDIGRIDVADRYAYAAVRREKASEVIRRTDGQKIKGVRTKVEKGEK